MSKKAKPKMDKPLVHFFAKLGIGMDSKGNLYEAWLDREENRIYQDGMYCSAKEAIQILTEHDAGLNSTSEYNAACARNERAARAFTNAETELKAARAAVDAVLAKRNKLINETESSGSSVYHHPETINVGCKKVPITMAVRICAMIKRMTLKKRKR